MARLEKTPPIITAMIEEYKNNKNARRPRKNEFTLLEIANFLKEVNDLKWFEKKYKELVCIQNGKELPLGKTEADKIRVAFVEKYFPKRTKEEKPPKPTQKEKEAEAITALFK